MMEALAMGDYGAYVWTSIGLAALIVGLNEWLARSRHRKVYREVQVRVKALEEKR
jgi:heme exporter protein CcmD